MTSSNKSATIVPLTVQTFWTGKDTVNFGRNLFRRMREKYGGETTLNELVLLNYLMCCRTFGNEISITAASEELAMPKTSVSRTLQKLVELDYICVIPHPEDSRRKLFAFTNRYANLADFDIDAFTSLASEYVAKNLSR